MRYHSGVFNVCLLIGIASIVEISLGLSCPRTELLTHPYLLQMNGNAVKNRNDITLINGMINQHGSFFLKEQVDVTRPWTFSFSVEFSNCSVGDLQCFGPDGISFTIHSEYIGPSFDAGEGRNALFGNTGTYFNTFGVHVDPYEACYSQTLGNLFAGWYYQGTGGSKPSNIYAASQFQGFTYGCDSYHATVQFNGTFIHATLTQGPEASFVADILFDFDLSTRFNLTNGSFAWMGITGSAGPTPATTRIYDPVFQQTPTRPLGPNEVCLEDGSLQIQLSTLNGSLTGAISLSGPVVIQSFGVPLILNNSSINIAGSLSIVSNSTLINIDSGSKEVLNVTDCASFSGALVLNVSKGLQDGTNYLDVAKYGCLEQQFDDVQVTIPSRDVEACNILPMYSSSALQVAFSICDAPSTASSTNSGSFFFVEVSTAVIAALLAHV